MPVKGPLCIGINRNYTSSVGVFVCMGPLFGATYILRALDARGSYALPLVAPLMEAHVLLLFNISERYDLYSAPLCADDWWFN